MPQSHTHTHTHTHTNTNTHAHTHSIHTNDKLHIFDNITKGINSKVFFSSCIPLIYLNDGILFLTFI